MAALSTLSPPSLTNHFSASSFPKLRHPTATIPPQSNLHTNYSFSAAGPPRQWRTHVSFFGGFLSNNKAKIAEAIKEELLESIAPLDRGAEATPQDQENIDKVTADLTPLNSKKVAVKFDFFKLGGLIPVKAPEGARGALEITYLDEELRVSRGDKGNLFILKMVDPSYRIP